ncbi:MAG: hypothetical protein RL456_3562 [Pseudomonadota bacterium]
MGWSRRGWCAGVMALGLAGAGCRHPAPAPGSGVRIRQMANGTQITGEENLLFETGKAAVKPEGQVFLNRLARALRDRPLANVMVEGHTDSTGSAAMNQTLSERRAMAVRQALVERGVPAARISVRGLGPTQPVGDNATPEGRAANRRTEIFVIGDSIDSLD